MKLSITASVLLFALAAAQVTSGQDPAPNVDYAVASSYYRAKDYERAANLLADVVGRAPNDERARALFVLTLLRQEKLEAARQQVTEMRATTPGAYARQLENLVSRFEALGQGKQQVMNALLRFRYEDALAAVKRMPVSDEMQTYLQAQLDVMRGDFGAARAALSGPTDPGQAARRAEVLKDIDAREKETINLGIAVTTLAINDAGVVSDWRDQREHVKLLADLAPLGAKAVKNGKLVNAKEATEYWRAADARVYQLMSRVLGITPLSCEVLSDHFFLSIFVTPYEKLEDLGDRILAACGSLVLQGVGKKGGVEVVIDLAERRISSRPSGEAQAWNHSFPIREPEPFDLKFDEITAIRQYEGFVDQALEGANRVPNGKFAALVLSPRGLIPGLATLRLFSSAYGELAARQAVQNLGRFVAHVVNRPGIPVTLLEVKQTGSSGVLSSIFASISAAGGNTVAADYFQQQAQEYQQQDASRMAVERVAFEQFFTPSTARSLGLEMYREMEDLLNLAK